MVLEALVISARTPSLLQLEAVVVLVEQLVRRLLAKRLQLVLIVQDRLVARMAAVAVQVDYELLLVDLAVVP
jgi:hypothetical protein